MIIVKLYPVRKVGDKKWEMMIITIRMPNTPAI